MHGKKRIKMGYPWKQERKKLGIGNVSSRNNKQPLRLLNQQMRVYEVSIFGHDNSTVTVSIGGDGSIRRTIAFG